MVCHETGCWAAGGGASLLCAICGGWLLHLAATAGQVGAAVAVSLLYGCTTELFPTSVRAAAMHACTLVRLRTPSALLCCAAEQQT